MRKILAVIALFALASCDSGAADGYSFEKKEYDRADLHVHVVEHRSAQELRNAFPDKLPEGRELMAWSILRKDGCEIHVVDPKVSYQPQWIGHEMTHCIWGRWHQ